MRESKKSKTEAVLKFLKDVGRTTAELLDVLPGYSETYRMMRKKIAGHMDIPKFDYKEWQKENEKRFYNLLSHLKKEGLVEKKRTNKQSFWQITKGGLRRLKFLEAKPIKQLPTIPYRKEPDNDWNLIIFDIPEKLKNKRVWLRGQLKLMGFQILQKSVWIGKYKIPEGFIHDLKDLNILSYTHILKVHKRGSLINLNL